MKATVVRSRALFRLWSLLVAGLLLSSLVLGFLTARANGDPNLHATVAIVVAALAVGSHIRRGGGWDFLAVVSLLAAVGLGLMVQGGGVAGDLHLAVAFPAAVLSSGLHLGRWRG